MGFIAWIFFGLVVGIVAKFLMPGRDPGGFIITAVLAVVGAVLGGFIGQSLGFYREGEPVGFLMAVIGSMILLLLYRMIEHSAEKNGWDGRAYIHSRLF